VISSIVTRLGLSPNLQMGKLKLIPAFWRVLIRFTPTASGEKRRLSG